MSNIKVDRSATQSSIRKGPARSYAKATVCGVELKCKDGREGEGGYLVGDAGVEVGEDVVHVECRA